MRFLIGFPLDDPIAFVESTIFVHNVELGMVRMLKDAMMKYSNGGKLIIHEQLYP